MNFTLKALTVVVYIVKIVLLFVMNSDEIFEDELHRPSVFKDETKLSIQYIPNQLKFRIKELKFLARHFKGLIEEGEDGKNLIIHGPVGTGKTSITKKFGNWASERKNERKIEYIHVNCRVNRSTYTILLAIARELNEHVPSRGYSSHELLDMVVDLLESKNMSLILVLDEVDFVPNEEISDLIYSLCRTADSKQDVLNYISLILIARTLQFVELLDDSTVSTLGATKLKLERYTEDQLWEIFDNRIQEVFKPNTVSKETIDLTASIAGNTGDARKGLELLWYAGKYADQQETSMIYPDYIRTAKSNIHPSGFRRTINSMGTQELLICYSIARVLNINKTAYVTTGQVRQEYQLSCEEFNIQPIKNTQFWDYITRLDKLGIIETRLSGEGQRGTTSIITVEDVSVANLEEVIRSLLVE